MLLHRWLRLCAFCKSSRARGAAVCSGPLRRSCHRTVGDLHSNGSVQRYIQQLMEDFITLDQKLQHACLCETDRRAALKKHTELLPVADVCQRIEQAEKDHQEVLSLLQGSAGTKDEDVQLSHLLKEEEGQLSQRILALKKEMVKAIVPTDPLDSSNVFLEVVSGRTTGGDICQQFTREMFDMYQGYASHKNWDFEVFNYTPSDYGGLHHAAVRVAGEGVYRHLKHEGGTHRVQRIPEVGLSSRMQRIHTGTMTVIILPQSQELDITVDQRDLRIDTFRSRGAGGQSVNTTDSAVRIVHLPTGISAECQQSRSQLQNRDTALCMLKARLYQSKAGKETELRNTARKQQVGSRSQSDRIRTYNFSQDRVTDHRTGYTARDIKEFMRGGEALDDLIMNVLEQADVDALLDLVDESMKTPKCENTTKK